MSNLMSATKQLGDTEADLLSEEDYQALESVLTQFAGGRAFLGEYVRRQGEAEQPPLPEMPLSEKPRSEMPLAEGGDTDRILRAIGDLHAAFNEHQSQSRAEHVRIGIVDMAKAIARTRSEIASMRTEGSYDQLTVASEEMDAIVQSTEKATTDILQAAERIQEVAWQLREAGAEEATCDIIDSCATDIYMACSFQDLTGQRTTKVVRVLQYLEARIDSMMEIWGEALDESRSGAIDAGEASPVSTLVDERPDAHLLNGPQAVEFALGQDNIDALLGEDGAGVDLDAGFATPELDAAMGQDSIDALLDEASPELSQEDMGQDNIDALMAEFDAVVQSDAEALADTAAKMAEAARPAPAVEAVRSEDDPVEDLGFLEDDGGEPIDEEKLKALFA